MRLCVLFCAAAMLTASLCGCATSGYKQFYQPTTWATSERVAALRAAPPSKSPTLDRARASSSDLVDAYVRHGYMLIGYSSFNSGRREDADDAIEQAEKVGADLVVVVDPHYTGSQTTSVPLTLPTTQTSYTNGTATAFGPGGVAIAYGNATTTTYGTQTEYIPMTVHRFDYGALYFVKAKPRPLGIHVRELNDSERAALQSNKGLVVQIVMDDSPAWRADILKGDIIEALDGEPVSTMAAFGDQTQARRGRDVTVTVIRNGQTITKHVKFND